MPTADHPFAPFLIEAGFNPSAMGFQMRKAVGARHSSQTRRPRPFRSQRQAGAAQMPEGDTIFRAARTLHRALAGKQVTAFQSVLPALTRINDDTPLAGRTIEQVNARGKHLLIHFSGDLVLRTHMRMNGSWHIYRPGEKWQRPRRDMRIAFDYCRLRGCRFQYPGGGIHVRDAPSPKRDAAIARARRARRRLRCNQGARESARPIAVRDRRSAAESARAGRYSGMSTSRRFSSCAGSIRSNRVGLVSDADLTSVRGCEPAGVENECIGRTRADDHLQRTAADSPGRSDPRADCGSTAARGSRVDAAGCSSACRSRAPTRGSRIGVRAARDSCAALISLWVAAPESCRRRQRYMDITSCCQGGSRDRRCANWNTADARYSSAALAPHSSVFRTPCSDVTALSAARDRHAAGWPPLWLSLMTLPALAMSVFLGWSLLSRHLQCRICWTGHVANAVLFVTLGLESFNH